MKTPNVLKKVQGIFGINGSISSASLERYNAIIKSTTLILVLIPAVFYLYTVFLSPRGPYAMAITDNEPAIYYNSRLLLDGRPFSHVVHPDMPLYYFGALVLRLVGDGLHGAMTWVNIHLGLAAFMTSISLYFLVTILRRTLPVSIIFLGLGILLCGPSMLRYLNLYAAESFNIALGLPALIMFWEASQLNQNTKRVTIYLLGSGILLSICIATKLTYMMLGVGFILGALIRILRQPLALKNRILTIALIASSFIVSLLIFLCPVLPSLLFVFGEAKGITPHWLLNLRKLLEEYPWLTTTCALGTIACLAHIFSSIWSNIKPPAGRLEEIRPFNALMDRDWLALSIILLSGSVGLVYALMLVTTNHWDTSHPQNLFRFISPYVLCAPFWLAAIYSWLSRSIWIERIIKWNLNQAMMALIILAISLSVTYGYAAHRRSILDELSIQNKADLQGLQHALKEINGPWVVWDDSSSILFGEASFHLWGNYMFAANAYDKDLLTAYPQLRWFHLRSLVPSIREGHLRGDLLSDLGLSINKPYRYRRSDSIADNEDTLHPPFVIIVRWDELENEVRIPNVRQNLLAALKDRFGDDLDPLKSRRFGFRKHIWLVIPVGENTWPKT